MKAIGKAMNASEARFEQEKNFDPVAYAEEVMKTVGADFHEDDPLFQTNEFRMHCYKILPCSKHFCHDWSVCPFAHFSERAKRRDPKEVKYTAIACPDMKKGEECPRGDRCPYSHNTFEYWLHPTRYRTRLCRDNEGCNRKICFFAHKPEEVRVPTSRPSLPLSEESWAAENAASKDEKEVESMNAGMSIRPADDVNLLELSDQSCLSSVWQGGSVDQIGQLQAFLQRNSLSVNTMPKNEPTFVDQVLSGIMPSSGMPPMSLADVQKFQIAQAAQSLSFDPCFQSPGMGHGALDHLAAGAGCFAPYTGFQGYVSALDSLVNSAPQLPFASAAQDLTVPQFSYPPLATAKAQPDFSEVLQMLSSMQMATSPTSVLAQRPPNQGGGLSQHAFSADSNATSAIGMSDSEMESTQIANALMGLSGGGPASSVAPGNALFGMTL